MEGELFSTEYCALCTGHAVSWGKWSTGGSCTAGKTLLQRTEKKPKSSER